MPPHPLTNSEMQKYYQNKPKFNIVYSRNNLSKVKDGTYTINLDEYELIRTHWIALYVNPNSGTYFQSFGVEHIGDENIIKNIYNIQANNSVMCGYVYIGFIEFM